MFKVERFFLLATCKKLDSWKPSQERVSRWKVFGVAPVTVALADTVVTVAVVVRLLLLLLMLLPMLLLLLLAACYVALATCDWGLATC